MKLSSPEPGMLWDEMTKLWLLVMERDANTLMAVLERFSIQYRETKTKVITPINHNKL